MNIFPFWSGKWPARLVPIALIILPLLSAALLLNRPASDAPAADPAQAAAPAVSIASAQPARWTRTLRVFGTLVAQDAVAISSTLADLRIARVLVEEGDHVHAGQVLAELDDTQHRARLRQAQAELDKARGELRAHQAEHDDAQRHHARLQTLGVGPVSAHLIEEQKARAQAALARMHAAQAQVQRAHAAVEQNSDQLEQTRILAPQAGLLLQRHAQAGALSGTQPLFVLAGQGRLELEGELPAQELALLQPGLTARIRLREQELTGTVRLVSPRIDPYTRLGKVRIALPDSIPRMQAGQFVQAVLELPSRDLSVTVPAACLVMDTAGHAGVMVVNEHRQAIWRRIRPGERHDGQVEILAGLQAGEHVVAQAAAFLRDGQEIIPSAP